MATVMTGVLFGALLLLFIGYGLLLRDILHHIRPGDKKPVVALWDIVSLAVVATLMFLVAVCFVILIGFTVSHDPATLWRAFQM